MRVRPVAPAAQASAVDLHSHSLGLAWHPTQRDVGQTPMTWTGAGREKVALKLTAMRAFLGWS